MLDQVLSEIPIFQNLERLQLYELNSWLVRKDAAAGDIILKQGAPTDGLYVLAKGAAEVFSHGDSGDVRIATLQSPSVIGEMGVLINEPRTAEVRATEPSILGFLPQELLEEKLAENNITALRIALTLGRIATLRLRTTTRKLLDLTQQHSDETLHV
jgi:SulP family sulfate permease